MYYQKVLLFADTKQNSTRKTACTKCAQLFYVCVVNFINHVNETLSSLPSHGNIHIWFYCYIANCKVQKGKKKMFEHDNNTLFMRKKKRQQNSTILMTRNRRWSSKNFEKKLSILFRKWMNYYRKRFVASKAFMFQFLCHAFFHQSMFEYRWLFDCDLSFETFAGVVVAVAGVALTTAVVRLRWHAILHR